MFLFCLSLYSKVSLGSLLLQSELHRNGDHGPDLVALDLARLPFRRCSDDLYSFCIQGIRNSLYCPYIRYLSILLDDELYHDLALFTILEGGLGIFKILVDPLLQELGRIGAVKELRTLIAVKITDDILIRGTLCLLADRSE